VISVLVPSRGRPDEFTRMVKSLYDTAAFADRIEVVCWLDTDDPAFGTYWTMTDWPIKYLHGGRKLLSECWNTCADQASGEILMHAGDDLTFNTDGWDWHVQNAFNQIPDRIGLVYGNDLSTNFPDLATHGFVHRNWVEAVGYFLPPLFSCDWNDVWLTEVAQKIGRAFPLPEVVIEHWHYTFGKAERDQTHADREDRGAADDVVGLFKRTANDRASDAQKLLAVMA
jgi:hypothetical protein